MGKEREEDMFLGIFHHNQIRRRGTKCENG